MKQMQHETIKGFQSVYQAYEELFDEISRRLLEDLELYYREVNLYYSFSKSFRIPFEEEWVYEERARISEKINGLLVRGAFRLTN